MKSNKNTRKTKLALKDENTETKAQNNVDDSFNNCQQKIKERKKCNLNIIFYDENLKNKDENKDICTFYEMNLSGTFYGCHYFELFKIVCKKIMRNELDFIIISSGSSAEKIFNYCKNINKIREYYIY